MRKGQSSDLHLSYRVDPVMSVTWADFVFEFQEVMGFHSSLSLIPVLKQ